MKFKLEMTILLVILIITGTVSAFPAEIKACNGCHTLSTSINVTSDVTSTLTVYPNQIFKVNTSWSGGSATKKTVTKWPTDFTNIGITRNNSLFDPTPDMSTAIVSPGGILSSALTAPNAIGNHIVRVYASTANPFITNFRDINITVEEPVVVLSTIRVSPSKAALNVNGTQVFIATALDQNKTPVAGVNIFWTVSNSAVGNVTPLFAETGPNGNASTTFTALTVGNATVVAENGTVSGSANVTIGGPTIPPSKPSIISILPSTATVNDRVGENRTFGITVDHAANISWQINGTEVSNVTGVTSSSYISSASLGTWNVTAVASNNGTDSHKWNWIVRSPPAVSIAIQSFAFNPASITILKGTSVIWTNNDVDAHTVTSDTAVFDSGTLDQGNIFEYTFNDTGTFKYHCAFHPTMHGEVIVISAPAPTPPPMEEIEIGLELVADNLTAPVALVSPEDGTGRRFIVDQIGLIKIINESGQIIEEPFLDLRSKIVALRSQYDERGLLGLAFHPNFTQNGYLFVYYSALKRQQAPANWDHTSIISEFKVSQDNQNKANESSERVLLQIDEPQVNHNAGQIAFGPDGYLYIPLGDGGGANDFGIGHPPPGNGQNMSTLLGKILRIDVDNGDPYSIPPDNPFVGKDGLDEIFASGFRNPFHISFDSGGNHSLFAGDAGQNAWEEVDIVTKGGNYGWNIKEGAHCFDPNNPNLSNQSCPSVDANGHPLIDPAIEYANAGRPGGIGVAVVGGYVYRGSALPQFNGTYIFGDFSKGFTAGNGSLFIARPPSSGEKMWSVKELRIATNSSGRIGEFVRSFGQDDDRELYVLTSQAVGPSNNTGKVYKIKQFVISHNFIANLSGREIVTQPVNTSAKGNATFELSDDGTNLHYKIMVEKIENVTMAHIHLAPAGVDGPVVAWLYPKVPPAVLIPGRFDGLLVEGNITSINLSGLLAGQPLNALLEAMMKGNAYVNVHTNKYPGGEIRGQIIVPEVLQELTSITVSPPTATLAINDTQIFSATAMDQNGTPMSGITIVWASNNTTVGDVSPITVTTDVSGGATTTFTAGAAGIAMITANNDTVMGNATVNVATLTPPTNVTVAIRTIEKESLRQGESTNITVDISSNISQTLSLHEIIPAEWNLTRVTDDADAFKSSTNEWIWFNVTPGINKTVIYRLTALDHASLGTYHINGTISNLRGVIAVVHGDNTITHDIIAFYRSLGSDPDKVETTDVLKAIEDWGNNIAPSGFERAITTQEVLALIDEWLVS